MTTDPHVFRTTAITELLRRLFSGLVLALLPAVVLIGCYAFVSDETPPDWIPDPQDAAEDVGMIASTGGPGAGVYATKCAVCHQSTGKGIPGVYPPLAGSAVVKGKPDLSVLIVLHGFQGPIERGGQKYNGVMQAWQNDLTDRQIADVVTFIRSNWGNNAPAVDEETVKNVRAATAKRLVAFQEQDLKSIQ